MGKLNCNSSKDLFINIKVVTKVSNIYNTDKDLIVPKDLLVSMIFTKNTKKIDLRVRKEDFHIHHELRNNVLECKNKCDDTI